MFLKLTRCRCPGDLLMYQTQFVSGKASLSSSACCSGSQRASWSSETGGARNEYLEINILFYLDIFAEYHIINLNNEE